MRQTDCNEREACVQGGLVVVAALYGELAAILQEEALRADRQHSSQEASSSTAETLGFSSHQWQGALENEHKGGTKSPKCGRFTSTSAA